MSESASPAIDQAGSNPYRFALFALTSLFFMWGFITCLNDILIPYLKGVFDLNYTQAMLIQFCFFGAYFLVSVPAGRLISKVGYQRGVVVGLLVAAVGCVAFYPAAGMREYGLFLGALFILASGITVLQVAANPYVTLLGAPQTASSRLNMTQAFNSLGTTVAPMFGSLLILSGSGETMPSQHVANDATAVQVPYLILAAALALIAFVFANLRLPEVSQTDTEATQATEKTSAWQYPHLVLGAVGIFVYVGAEVAIGSFLINFISQDHIAGISEAEAATYVTLFWGGAMVGRFIGAVVMHKIPAPRVLLFNAGLACVFLIIGMLGDGSVAMWAIVAMGLCNSIMFPTIFSLAISGLGKFTSQGSGILCLAIVGGAIVPVMQGALADAWSIQVSFALPIVCYLYIAFYALKGHRVA